MSDQLDRPARPARRPRPAADAGVDPIDYRATPTEEAPAAAPVSPAAEAPAAPTPPTSRRGDERAAAPIPPAATGPAARDVTVQLNSRIGVDVAAIFDAAAARFKTKREALEHAILVAYGEGK